MVSAHDQRQEGRIGPGDAAIAAELTKLEEDMNAVNLSFQRAIAERIAQADISRARQLLSRHIGK